MSIEDRELLGLAAKAAGINFWWHNSGRPMQTVHYLSGNPDDDGLDKDIEWNPLLSDADAFALAVETELRFSCKRESDPFEKNVSVAFGPYSPNQVRVVEKHYGGNFRQATRRVVVRAAAEIGRRMP